MTLDWKHIEYAKQDEDGTWYLLGFFGPRPDGFPPVAIGLWDGEQWNGNWCFLDDSHYGPEGRAMQPTHYAMALGTTPQLFRDIAGEAPK